jgi:hypothetical protein
MSARLLRRIVPVLLLATLSAARAAEAPSEPRAAARILIDKPVRAGALTLFPDLGDDKAYFYISDKPRLATDENGRPQFSFLRWVDNVRSGAEQAEAREGEGGGIVHAVVALSVTPEQLRDAQRELQRKKPGAKIVGYAPYASGIFGLVSSFKDPKTGNLSTQVVGLGKAPLLDGEKAAVSILLTKQGAKILWESFETPTPDISFSFEMELHGYHSPLSAKIEANWEQVYEHEAFGAGFASTYLSAEINAAFDDLRRSGAIKLTQVGDDAALNTMVATAYNKLTDLMFSKVESLDPAQLARAGAQDSLMKRAGDKLAEERKATETRNSSIRSRNDQIRARNQARDNARKEMEIAQAGAAKVPAAQAKLDAMEQGVRDAEQHVRELQCGTKPGGGDATPKPTVAPTSAPTSTPADGAKPTPTPRPGSGDVSPKPTPTPQPSGGPKPTATPLPSGGPKATPSPTPTPSTDEKDPKPDDKAPDGPGPKAPGKPKKRTGEAGFDDRGPKSLAVALDEGVAAKTRAAATDPFAPPTGPGSPQACAEANDRVARARSQRDAAKAELDTLKTQSGTRSADRERLAGEPREGELDEESLPGFAVMATYEIRKVRQSGTFVLDLNKYLTGSLTTRFDENIGDLRRLKKDAQHFRQVNLDDPLFKQREIVAMVDGYDARDFGEWINFVTVQVRKKHAGGVETNDEVRIDRKNFNSAGNAFKLLYGWQGDNDRRKWLDYEYRTSWSFFGGQAIELPWKKATAGAVSVAPPFQRRKVTLEADPARIAAAGVRAITARLYFSTGGAEQTRQVTLDPAKRQLSAEIEILLPAGTFNYGYEILWRLPGNRTVSSGRQATSESVLFVDEVPST